VNGSNRPTFELGLTMAGAVSAGAYTAGVIDFLMQALDEWQNAIEVGAPETPNHAVNLRVISGASAGALVGAIISANSRASFPPVRPGTDQVQGPLNPFFSAWVNRIDISELLKLQDLAAGGRPRNPTHRTWRAQQTAVSIRLTWADANCESPPAPGYRLPPIPVRSASFRRMPVR
jgi:hypothetical protein